MKQPLTRIAALGLISLVLAGCASTKDAVLPQDGTSMKAIYEAHVEEMNARDPQIVRGALLLVSDLPMTPEGVKTTESDAQVTHDWSDTHLEIGIESLVGLEANGERIKHFQY